MKFNDPVKENKTASMIRAFLSYSTLLYAFATYGFILLVGVVFSSSDGGLISLLIWARNTALFLSVIIVVSFGISAFNSPWRMLWRRYPRLNRWLYPDLNGVWLGETRSNWPVIESTLKHATSEGAILADDLATIPLKSDPIAVQIKAHWFGMKLQVKTSATNGGGKADDVIASRNVRGRDFEISYIFEQSVPDPLPTDQDHHMGAATLDAKVAEETVLEGEYWNRRSWRKGLNAAGIMTLRRVSEKHVPAGFDLLSEAQRMAAESSET